MSSSSDRVSLSSSSGERSGGSGSSRADSREESRNVGRIPMERVVEVREDPPEELRKATGRRTLGTSG